MRKNLFISAATAGLVGCFPITVNVNTTSNATMTVALGDLSGTCSGSTTVTGDKSTATVTKTASGDNCNISVVFEADALDMADIRAKVEKAIDDKGKDPKDVSVNLKKGTELVFDTIVVQGVTVPSSAWKVDASIAATKIIDQAGDNLATLATTSVSVALDDGQIKVLNDAYDSRSIVKASGNFELSSVPLSYIASLPKTDASVTFNITADVAASGSMETF